MNPRLEKFGISQTPVVVVDDFTGDPEKVAAVADALAPFPPVGHNYYPGVRRIIQPSDEAAEAAMAALCRRAGPFIAGAFDIPRFRLIEASFSMVTRQPASLDRRQRVPHYDSTDPAYLALLLYLRVPAGSGTAFYRQRSTGIEQVTERNAATLNAVAEVASMAAEKDGYISGSTAHYEQIGVVEAVPDRMLIYQGSLLHSGIIPEGMNFSADPREGRLTANLFVRGE